MVGVYVGVLLELRTMMCGMLQSAFAKRSAVAARVLAGVSSPPRSGRLSVTGRCRVSCRWSGGGLRRRL